MSGTGSLRLLGRWLQEEGIYGFGGKKSFVVFDGATAAELGGHVARNRGERIEKFLQRVIGGKILEKSSDRHTRVFENRGASQNLGIDGDEVARVHGSTVGIFAMADAGDADDSDFVGDFIDDSIAAHADPPVIFRTD